MREGKPFEKGFPLSRSPFPKLSNFEEVKYIILISYDVFERPSIIIFIIETGPNWVEII